MYRLCIGYVSVILYAGCGKDGTKIRQNFGIHNNFPTLARSKAGRAGEYKTTDKGLQSLTASRCTLFAGTLYAPKSSALQAFTGCFYRVCSIWLLPNQMVLR